MPCIQNSQAIHTLHAPSCAIGCCDDTTSFYSFQSTCDCGVIVGPTGPAGATGIPGATGPPNGPAGPQGATGATGPAGAAGIQGLVGPAGPVGATGATGPAGAEGATGATGPAGTPGVTGSLSLKYAEFVQNTQGTNNSVAPGKAFEFLTDNPTGIVNTIPVGFTATTAPTSQGTVFILPIGVYMIDYETSMSSVGPIALASGPGTGGPFTAILTSKSGSTTATTWVHGRYIIDTSVDGQFIILTGTDSVTAAVAPTPAGGSVFLVRITFLKLA